MGRIGRAEIDDRRQGEVRLGHLAEEEFPITPEGAQFRHAPDPVHANQHLDNRRRRSGAHINPAVTLALAATGRFPWGKVLPYALAQTAGGFLGAAIVFADFKAKWLLADPALVKTAGIFCTFPAVPGFWPGFIDHVIGTAVLLFGILSIGDFGAKNKVPWIGPVAVAMLVMAIGMSLGAMNGYAINPARDFGPRFFALVAGFTQPNLMDASIVLVPILGPLVGGALGAFVYDMTTGGLNKDPDASFCEDGAQECES